MKRILIFACLSLVFAVSACNQNTPFTQSDAPPLVSATANATPAIKTQRPEAESEQTEQTPLTLNPTIQNTLTQLPDTKSPVTQPPPTQSATTQQPTDTQDPKDTEEQTMTMNVQIGSHVFTATLEDNAAVDSLIELMNSAPIVIHMSDYSGFEKVGPLGTSLPRSDVQTTTQSGDIVLYNGNQIVIFYGSNSWPYTRLGRIDDLSGWEAALGSGDVTVTFSLR